MAKAVILKELAEKIGIKVYQLEAEIGSSNGSIAKAIKNNKEITGNLIEKILKKYPKVSRAWLETGVPPIYDTGGKPLKPAPSRVKVTARIKPGDPMPEDTEGLIALIDQRIEENADSLIDVIIERLNKIRKPSS